MQRVGGRFHAFVKGQQCQELIPEDIVGMNEVVIEGVLTYEDVIERTLRVNINDEKDR